MKKLYVLIMLLGFQVGFCQLYEGFEGTFPPPGWLVADSGAGTQSWQLNPTTIDPLSGEQSVFIDRQNIGSGNTSEDWLITPLVDIGINYQIHAILSTTIGGDQNSHFQIRVSNTTQSDLSNFVTIESITESEATALPNVGYSIYTNLNQYVGQSVYIAFVRVNTQVGSSMSGDKWLLDDITISQFTGISGTVVFGTDDWCSGPPLPNIRINANGFSLTSTFTNSLGDYALNGSGTDVVVSPIIENQSNFTILPPSFTLDFNEDLSTTTANFCIIPNGTYNDLSIVLLPLQNAVPGFDGTYRLIYKNHGNVPQSGTVNLQFNDDVLDFISATPAPNATILNNLTWQFSNLLPFQTRSIEFTLNVNASTDTPAVNIGDELNFLATVSTAASDETPGNNNMDLVQTVVGAYDPNDKTVLEGSEISLTQAGEYLHYLIRFQNSGTAPAQNVVIRDIIAGNFDLSTLQFIASSHPSRTVISNRLVSFYFDNIMLPAEQDDEPGSHGFVAFKIKPQSNVVLGDVLNNKANIYFDYNLPIVTNTASTTITALSVDALDRNIFNITPNPAHDLIKINMNNPGFVNKVCIINMLGQVVKEIAVADTIDVLTVDISNLNAGTYLVQLSAESGVAVQKLIKHK